MEKIKEDNWKVGKISWVVSQTLALGPKHDKIWARWVLDIMSQNLLKKVIWRKNSEWNLEVEPFIAQMEGNKRELEVI
jgi:hypothetical protein